MAGMLKITGFVLLFVEIFAGMVANGFIVLINCMDWFRKRKLSTTDLILTCLGLSRLMWQATVTLHVILFSFFLHIYTLNRGHETTILIWLFTNKVNFWFAAWLSVLYFVKIGTFCHPVFLQMKLQFPGMVPWLLLSSVAFSALMTIPVVLWLNIDVTICDLSTLHFNKSYDSENGMPHSPKHLMMAFLAPNFVPSAIVLSSTVLLIISLWKHIRRLQCNGIGVRDLSTSAHLAAIKALASFAILYLSTFVAVTLQIMLVLINKDCSWASLVFNIVNALSPSVHTVILILINPKLKQAWVRMIEYLKCPLREAQS